MAMVLRTNKKITDWILDKTFGPKGGKPEEGGSAEVNPSSDKPPAAATTTLSAPADTVTTKPVVTAPEADEDNESLDDDASLDAVKPVVTADQDDEITPPTASN